MAYRDARHGVTSGPLVSAEVVRDYAADQGVCVRPLLRRVTDRVTGEVERLIIPCGSTRESVCAPCAQKARRLRMQQCSEGWHLTEDPLAQTDQSEIATDVGPGADAADDGRSTEDSESRRVRSTRRRSDAADLPRLPVEQRSVGRTFIAADGTTYRPSMFVTLTLGSYGRVDPWQAGCAGSACRVHRCVRPATTTGGRRWRRCTSPGCSTGGCRTCAVARAIKVQYFGAIEPQRRLAPHIHVAIRGAIPREVIRAVTRATYLQLWWPSFDEPRLRRRRLPWWDAVTGAYRDPATGVALPTWEQALDELDADPDARAGGGDAVRHPGRHQGHHRPVSGRGPGGAIPGQVPDQVGRGHLRRPRSSRPGVRGAHRPAARAGACTCPARRRAPTGCGTGSSPRTPAPAWSPAVARRRPTTGRTSASAAAASRSPARGRARPSREHRADRATVVREVLAEAGIEAPEIDRMAADMLAEDGLPRFVWDDDPGRVGRTTSRS